MKEFIKVMKALSDPNRVKIIKLLQQQTFCVCEIQEALGLAQSTTSKHLKTLEEAELITYSKEGQWVYYQLSNRGENPYACKLLENLKHWLKDDESVLEVLENLSETECETLCKK